jgi:hypothetical protein
LIAGTNLASYFGVGWRTCTWLCVIFVANAASAKDGDLLSEIKSLKTVRLCLADLAALGRLQESVQAFSHHTNLGSIIPQTLHRQNKVLAERDGFLKILRPDIRAKFAKKWDAIEEAHKQRVRFFTSGEVIGDSLPQLTDEQFKDLARSSLDAILRQEKELTAVHLESEEAKNLADSLLHPDFMNEFIAEAGKEYQKDHKTWSVQFLNAMETRDTREANLQIAHGVNHWMSNFDALSFFELQGLSNESRLATYNLLSSSHEPVSKISDIPASFLACRERCPTQQSVDQGFVTGVMLKALVGQILQNPSSLWIKFKDKERWIVALPEYQLDLSLNVTGSVESIALLTLSEAELMATLPKDPALVSVKRDLAKQNAEPARIQPEVIEVPDANPIEFTANQIIPQVPLDEIPLLSDFREFLKALESRFPEQSDLVRYTASFMSGLEALQTRNDIRDRVEQAAEFNLGPDFVEASIAAAMEKQATDVVPTQPSDGIPQDASYVLRDRVLSRDFKLSELKPDYPYDFAFNQQGMHDKVMISPEALTYMGLHHGKRWLLKFFKGPVGFAGQEGLKRLRGGSKYEWEIKLMARGHHRLGVEFNSKTKIWHIREGFTQLRN